MAWLAKSSGEEGYPIQIETIVPVA
ncbi:hypothetical protein SBA7_1700005 [Candidatus Sulfotelmatobacter sp. SbA7]|nr:hypothetical protein SBA7_1700005 [Candidatus Sulfotelmatobacter sp. SbA7]